MKVLKIWSTFQTELKYHDHYLAEEMDKQGIITEFLSTDIIGKDYKEFISIDNATKTHYKHFRINRIKSIEFFGVPLVYDIVTMYKYFKKSDAEIIHLFGIGNPVSMMSLIILALTSSNKVIVANDHSHEQIAKKGFIPKIYYSLFRLLYKLLGKKIRKIFVPNQASYRYLKKMYGAQIEQKMKIIPLGYDDKTFYFNKSQKNVEKPFVIGFAGKIVEAKRIDTLLDVVIELSKKYNIKCIIVGISDKEPTEYQKKVIQKYQNYKNIEFRKIIKEPCNLAKFYNYIDLAVFPGSISITTIEANGCGTPVLIYESIEGLTDRVENERGRLFKTKDELKNYIEYYINSKINNEYIEKMTKKYSWSNIAKIYIQEYNDLLKTKGMKDIKCVE